MKFYCPIPFYSLEINPKSKSKLCCVSGDTTPNKYDSWIEFWQGKEMNSIRATLLDPDAKMLPNCKYCHAQETNGLNSMRREEIKRKGIITVPKRFPTELQLKLSNICNLKCLMCSSSASDKWNDDVDLVSDLQKNARKLPVENFNLEESIQILNNFILNNKKLDKKLTLYGGEPLIHKKFWEHIETYDDNDLRYITLHVVTNATIFNLKIINTFTKFKRTYINLSIDGAGDFFEYTRYPAKWKLVEKNIHLFKNFMTVKDNINLTILNTISSFSAPGLPEFLEFCKKYRLKYQLRPCIVDSFATDMDLSRSYSHPAILNSTIKNKILKNCKRYLTGQEFTFLNNLFNDVNFIDPYYQKNFDNYVARIDKIRNLHFYNLIDQFLNE